MTEVAEAPVQEDVSAGTLLRRAREAAGLHVAALAVALKVPVRKLEALEENRYEDLGDPVFIRGLASSVCRTLKADPQPVLSRLPQTAAPRLIKDNDGLNAPFRAPGDGPMPTWIDRLRQPVPAIVLALLAGAVAIYFLPAARHEDNPAPPLAASLAAPSPLLAEAPQSAAPAASAPVLAVAATTVPMSRAEPSTATPAATPAVAAPPAATAASAAPSPAPLPTSGIVTIHTKGDSWVEVVDAKGNVEVRKIMAPGEVAGASGALPLTVTIGRADMTDVEVRGRKFDMRPVSKDNVARFTVK